MTTLETLQELFDGEFHSLCDDLFRRLEPRYRRLRPHGINVKGVSIRGQPDSYVGETANTCIIAFQYSVQRRSWWTKIAADVRDAVKASPGVQEIVVATPRNIDREGPEDENIDWLATAKSEADKATLQLYDGPFIAQLLDKDYPDLRFVHLRIPYSRLSGQSILASCQEANSKAIAELETSGRYDPARYCTRDADRRLFELWQNALRVNDRGAANRGPIRLIALVNDSGLGKTSLLAKFVQSLSSTLPAVIIQARDLAFTPQDSLVSHVVQVLQGTLAPHQRLEEEAAIVRNLTAGIPFTMAVDGLDEADDADSVRRAISFWLKSKLGRGAFLSYRHGLNFGKRAWTRAGVRGCPKMPCSTANQQPPLWVCPGNSPTRQMAFRFPTDSVLMSLNLPGFVRTSRVNNSTNFRRKHARNFVIRSRYVSISIF